MSQANSLGGKAWQVQNHEGFIKSFMSTARYGPISKQQRDWERVREWLTLQKFTDLQTTNPYNDQVLIILGKSDQVIPCEELQEDATKALGTENVKFKILDAGHELPITKSKEIIRYMVDFWNLEQKVC